MSTLPEPVRLLQERLHRAATLQDRDNRVADVTDAVRRRPVRAVWILHAEHVYHHAGGQGEDLGIQDLKPFCSQHAGDLGEDAWNDLFLRIHRVIGGAQGRIVLGINQDGGVGQLRQPLEVPHDALDRHRRQVLIGPRRQLFAEPLLRQPIAQPLEHRLPNLVRLIEQAFVGRFRFFAPGQLLMSFDKELTQQRFLPAREHAGAHRRNVGGRQHEQHLERLGRADLPRKP